MKRFTLHILISFLIYSCTEQKELQSTRPNVIIVITDDQGYGDLRCHGNPFVKTPHLDALHSRSVRLTNYHVGTTCAPTRAGLMTGRNCNRNGVWHTIGGASLLHEREYTLANLLSENGYKTGIFGKWHLGDAYPFRPEDRGFDEVVVHGGGGVGQTPDYWNNNYFDDTYFHNGTPEKYSGYCTDIFFDEGIKFIEKNQDEPFFTYITTNAPHGPLNVPEHYRAMYDDLDSLSEDQKRFYGMITNIDDNMGKLVSKLDQLGLTENTILVFTTDNGTAVRGNAYNANMRGKKVSEYDGGHRVPFFIHWPKGRLSGGIDVRDLTAHVDVLPTMAGLCGLTFNPSNKMDGIDITELLSGKDSAKDRMLVTDTQRVPWPVKGKQSCVMTTDYRLVNGDELYHIFDDPGQTRNIAEAHPKLVQKMTDFYDEWWSDISETFEYSLFRVGSEEQNPITITIHDGHINEAVPWHQGYIREGKFPGLGPIYIDVVEDGSYNIEISRYPKESGLAIGSEAEDSYPSTSNYVSRPKGRALSFEMAEVIANGQKYQSQVDLSRQSVIFRGIKMKKGFDKLSANFVMQDGTEYGAYYFYIFKNDGV